MKTNELLFINAYIGLILPMPFCMELVGSDQYNCPDYEYYLACFFWDVGIPAHYIAPGTPERALLTEQYQRRFFHRELTNE